MLVMMGRYQFSMINGIGSEQWQAGASACHHELGLCFRKASNGLAFLPPCPPPPLLVQGTGGTKAKPVKLSGDTQVREGEKKCTRLYLRDRGGGGLHD